MTAKERKHLALMRAIYRAYSDKRLKAENRTAPVLAALGPRSRLVEHASRRRMEWGGTYVGPKGWAQFFKNVSENLDHDRYVCTGMIARGDYVCAWGVFQTKCRRTRRSCRLPWIHRIRFERGRIAQLDEFYDSLEGALRLGRA